MCKITISWELAIPLTEFDNNKSFLQENGGIYLWVFKGDPLRTMYIGETSNYAIRFTEHFSRWLSGRYAVYDISVSDDYVDYFKKNFSGKDYDTVRKGGKVYIPKDPKKDTTFSFEEAFVKKGWEKWAQSNIDNLVFFFGCIKDHQDTCINHYKKRNIRKMLEGAFILSVRSTYAIVAGIHNESDFYVKDDKRRTFPVGAVSKNPSGDYVIIHDGKCANQLPEEISGIKSISSI